MELKWKPILLFCSIIMATGLAISTGMYLYKQYKLNQIDFAVTRVEFDTVYDDRYKAMFKMYFYIDHNIEDVTFLLRLYETLELVDETIDVRFWQISKDTDWISMQFGRAENETAPGTNQYRLTAQKTEILSGELLSNEVTVWDGETSSLQISPFDQTFGIEVTKVEIGEYSTHEAWGWVTLRNYTLRFYIFNHEDAGNVTFELCRELYDEDQVIYSQVADSCRLHIEHGEAGYIELKGGSSEEHEVELDLRYYKLEADAPPYILWYGRDEEPLPVEK